MQSTINHLKHCHFFCMKKALNVCLVINIITALGFASAIFVTRHSLCSVLSIQTCGSA